MHIIFLAYHYPPSPAVGALRAAKVTRALLAAGHRVTVIRATESPDAQPTFENQGRLEVRTVVSGLAPGDVYTGVKRWLRRPGGDAAGVGLEPAVWVPPARVSLPKRFVFSLMRLPDDHQGFIRPAAAEARRVLMDSTEPTLLYTSGPPHSTHLAGLLARRWIPSPWVIEYRDPWADNPGKPSDARTPFTDAVDRWLERACLRRASLVVCASDGIAKILRSTAAHGPDRILVIRNGIDRLAPDRPSTGPRRPVRIVYAGTFYLGRDPTRFLQALGAVAARHHLGPNDVEVEFIGNCASFEGRLVRDIVANAGVTSLIRDTPWLPHGEAIKRIENADLLLLLAEGQPNQVPNKFYEYLGTRRPMLIFADEGGETARMANEVGGHYIVGNDLSSATAALEDAILRAPTRGPQLHDRDVLEGCRTANQMAKLVEAVERVGADYVGGVSSKQDPDRPAAGRSMVRDTEQG